MERSGVIGKHWWRSDPNGKRKGGYNRYGGICQDNMWNHGPSSTLVEGTLYIKATVRKKEGGRIEKVGYWRTPPRDREL